MLKDKFFRNLLHIRPLALLYLLLQLSILFQFIFMFLHHTRALPKTMPQANAQTQRRHANAVRNGNRR